MRTLRCPKNEDVLSEFYTDFDEKLYTPVLIAFKTAILFSSSLSWIFYTFKKYSINFSEIYTSAANFNGHKHWMIDLETFYKSHFIQ